MTTTANNLPPGCTDAMVDGLVPSVCECGAPVDSTGDCVGSCDVCGACELRDGGCECADYCSHCHADVCQCDRIYDEWRDASMELSR